MSIYFQLIRGLKYFAERSYEDTMRVQMIRGFQAEVRGWLNLLYRTKSRTEYAILSLRRGLAPGIAVGRS